MTHWERVPAALAEAYMGYYGQLTTIYNSSSRDPTIPLTSMAACTHMSMQTHLIKI